jgi:hypothetical protein
VLFGLLDDPSILLGGVTPPRMGAAALSLALTGAVLLLLRASHLPAGATVLIVSLGLLTKPSEMAMIMVGMVILAVARWAINRALGVPVPPPGGYGPKRIGCGPVTFLRPVSLSQAGLVAVQLGYVPLRGTPTSSAPGMRSSISRPRA